MKDIVISEKTKKIAIYVAAALLIYSIIGFLVIPAVLSNQIPKITAEHLNRTSTIKEVKFNPFSLELDLQGFKIKNKSPSTRTFASFDRLYVNLAVLRSIFSLTPTVDRIMIKQPYAFVKRDKKGAFNFSDLISDTPKEEEPPSDEGIFPVTLTKLTLSEGKLDWEDDFYNHPQKETIFPLNLNADNLTTVENKQSDAGINIGLASGGNLNWNGKLQLTPLNSTGKIKLDKLAFQKTWELFVQDSVNFEVLKGSELVELDYELMDSEQGIQFLINDAHIDIYDVKIAEKGNTDPVISIPDFKISGIAFDLLKRNVTINKVSAQQAQFKAWLNTEGEINYQKLFATQGEKAPATPQKKLKATEKEAPWTVSVKQLAIGDFAFNFIDKSLPETPATIDVTDFSFNVADFSTKPGTKLPFDLGLTLNKSGKIKIKGDTVLEPFSSDLVVDVNDMALIDFQPYVDAFAKLSIISGLFNTHVNVAIKQEDNKPLDLIVKGDSHIDDLVTRDQVSNKDFVKWKKLSLNKIDVNLAANSYLIDTVKIEHPYARVLIRKDKSINVTDITKDSGDKKETSEEKEKPSSAEDEANKPTFKITQIDIIEGESDFSDLSLILPFSAHINHLKGKVKGISSDKNAVIKTALKGRVANLAPVNIKGKISPGNGNSNFDLDFKGMPLPLMTPYMAEFAGRKIEKGNMSLSLKYDIKNKKLKASNNLLIDQLTLGEKVDNPKAVSLPLGLAIALLEDSDGKIKLEMPITGSLDDPQFSIGGLIFDTLVNVLTKIVASPFNAVASLIDSEEDISKITFLAGKSDLDTSQQTKLDQLAGALTKRPALKLEIRGSSFSKEDWPELQKEALNKKIIKVRATELSKDSGQKVLPENVEKSEKEDNRVLADLFISKYPKLADKSIFGTPRLIDSEEDFYEVAQAKLASDIPPNPERLQQLAVERAQKIAKHLNAKELSVERVFLLNAVVDPKDTENQIAATLNLTTK
jgi:hypothetical protein